MSSLPISILFSQMGVWLHSSLKNIKYQFISLAKATSIKIVLANNAYGYNHTQFYNMSAANP